MGPKNSQKAEGAINAALPRGKSSGGSSHGFDQVMRNSKGGVEVTHSEIEAAFAFLDKDGKGKVTVGDLKKRLSTFFPDLTTRDFKYLMDNKKELVLNDVIEILENNEIKEFDPVAQAYMTYDPEGKGFIAKEKLEDIFSTFGFGELTPDELGLLTKAADVDGDGVVSLSDFRLVRRLPPIPPLTPNIRLIFDLFFTP